MVIIEVVFVNYFIYFVSHGAGVGHFWGMVKGSGEGRIQTGGCDLRSGARATRTSWRLRREMTRSLWAVLARVHLGSSKSANAHREQWMREPAKTPKGNALRNEKEPYHGLAAAGEPLWAIVNANCFSLANFNWHHPAERQEIGKARAQRLVKEGWLALG